MVEIGLVGVRVFEDLLVRVLVNVKRRSRQPGMRVRVMFIIVPVPMHVGGGLMPMGVHMALRVGEVEGAGHQRAGGELCAEHVFAQPGPAHYERSDGSGGEEHL